MKGWPEREGEGGKIKGGKGRREKDD